MKAFLNDSRFALNEFEIRVDDTQTTYIYENTTDSHGNFCYPVNLQLTGAFDNETGFEYPDMVVHQIRVGQNAQASLIRDMAVACYNYEYAKWKENYEYESARRAEDELSLEELAYTKGL